jgi:hypothetical protein
MLGFILSLLHFHGNYVQSGPEYYSLKICTILGQSSTVNSMNHGLVSLAV